LVRKPAGKSKKLLLKGEKSKILLVGGGKMGRALLAGWKREGISSKKVLVVEPLDLNRDIISKEGFSYSKTLPEIEKFNPDVIIFAVKPDQIAGVLPWYYERFEKALFISIAAGITIEFIKKHSGIYARVVRAMPNLAATIGQGVTVVAGDNVLEAEYGDFITKLFSSVGSCYWAIEQYMDAVTAVSGSGPAYFFYLAECLMEAAEAHNIPKELAKNLVLQTMKGSALMAYDPDRPVSILRQEVTSPGGTTEAALKVLNQDNRFKNLIKEAVKAAAERAEKLTK